VLEGSKGHRIVVRRSLEGTNTTGLLDQFLGRASKEGDSCSKDVARLYRSPKLGRHVPDQSLQFPFLCGGKK
jgi:hypothetical protein